MEYVKTHMRMDLLWIDGFEVLIAHISWYLSCKLCIHIFPMCRFLKGQHSFLPHIFFLEGVTYNHNLPMKFCDRGCAFPEYLGSQILQCVKPPPHLVFPDLVRLNISLTKLFTFWEVVVNTWILKHIDFLNQPKLCFVFCI